MLRKVIQIEEDALNMNVLQQFEDDVRIESKKFSRNQHHHNLKCTLFNIIESWHNLKSIIYEEVFNLVILLLLVEVHVNAKWKIYLQRGI